MAEWLRRRIRYIEQDLSSITFKDVAGFRPLDPFRSLKSAVIDGPRSTASSLRDLWRASFGSTDAEATAVPETANDFAADLRRRGLYRQDHLDRVYKLARLAAYVALLVTFCTLGYGLFLIQNDDLLAGIACLLFLGPCAMTFLRSGYRCWLVKQRRTSGWPIFLRTPSAWFPE